MADPIKAIETSYRGYRFRSRLEARWAVFFDMLNIDWRYEPEGFELSDGTRYLPDFHLPRFNDDNGLWVEVKPENGAWDKAKRFAIDSGRAVWLAYGDPGANTYDVVSGCCGDRLRTCDHEGELDVMGGCVPLASKGIRENRMYWCADWEFDDTGLEGWLLHNGPHVLAATAVARAARFEFGETPATSAIRVKDTLRAIWKKHFQLQRPDLPANVWDLVLDFAEGEPA